MKRDTKKLEQETVHQLINQLTNDEDHRQELWLHYLSGNQPDTFASYLQKITLQEDDYIKLQTLLWQLSKNPLSDNLMKVIEGFSELERSIIVLVMLGLDVPGISRYNGISEVRIRQVIATIRNNNRWNRWLSNEISQITNDMDLLKKK